MDGATSIFRDMGLKAVTPDLITYSTLIKGHCTRGDLEKGLQLLGLRSTTHKTLGKIWEIWGPGNPEMLDPQNEKSGNSQIPNPFCPKCRQGLD